MRATLLGARWMVLAGIVALITAVSLLGGAAPVMAADGGSIEIHGRICPVAFAGADYYSECHDDPLADVTYTVTLLGSGVVGEATTDDTGNLFFDGLAFGTYVIEESVPGDFAQYRVYCSDQSGATVPFVYTDTGGAQLDLAVAGQAIVCDWYIVPDNARGETASVTIYNVICPTGYRGDDFFGDCYDTPLPDVSFSLTGASAESGVTAVTGSNGFVAFDGIATDGRYVVAEDIPGEFNQSVVYCSANGQPFPVAEAAGTNSIALDLTVADDLRCDWYNVPEDLRGDVPAATQPAATQPTSRPVGATRVVGLPNTGGRSGAAVHPKGGNDLALVGSLIAAGVAGLVWSRRLPRRQPVTSRALGPSTPRRES